MFSGQIIFNNPYQNPNRIYDRPYNDSFQRLQVDPDRSDQKSEEPPAVKADKDIQEAKIQSNTKFDELVKESGNILHTATSVFPFKLFPAHLVITPTKVDIIDQIFFFSEHIHSVMIKDVSDVLVDTSLFFASLQIVDRGYVENFITIPFLWKKDALKARDIIQGLVTSDKTGVDIATLDQDGLSEKAEELGKVRSTHVSQI